MLPRSLPHDADAEKGLLSSIILRPDLLNELTDIKPEAFYTLAHALVYERLPALYARDQTLDFLALKRRLECDKLLEEVGGTEALDEIWSFIPTSANWKYYSDQVRENHQRRIVIREAQRLSEMMFDPATDMASAITGTVEETLTALTMQVTAPPKTNREELHELLEEIEARALDQKTKGIITGIMNLDARLLPFRPGNDVVVSGKTSDG